MKTSTTKLAELPYKKAEGILHSSFHYNVSRDISIVMICWHYGPAGFPQSSLASAIRYTMEALSFVDNWYPPFLHRSPFFPVAFDRKSEGGFSVFLSVLTLHLQQTSVRHLHLRRLDHLEDRGDEKWSNILKGGPRYGLRLLEFTTNRDLAGGVALAPHFFTFVTQI